MYKNLKNTLNQSKETGLGLLSRTLIKAHVSVKIIETS